MHCVAAMPTGYLTAAVWTVTNTTRGLRNSADGEIVELWDEGEINHNCGCKHQCASFTDCDGEGDNSESWEEYEGVDYFYDQTYTVQTAAIATPAYTPAVPGTCGPSCHGEPSTCCVSPENRGFYSEPTCTEKATSDDITATYFESTANYIDYLNSNSYSSWDENTGFSISKTAYEEFTAGLTANHVDNGVCVGGEGFKLWELNNAWALLYYGNLDNGYYEPAHQTAYGSVTYHGCYDSGSFCSDDWLDCFCTGMMEYYSDMTITTCQGYVNDYMCGYNETSIAYTDYGWMEQVYYGYQVECFDACGVLDGDSTSCVDNGNDGTQGNAGTQGNDGTQGLNSAAIVPTLYVAFGIMMTQVLF